MLFADLAACNAYQNALVSAAQVKVPTSLILGERDMMTPAKSGLALSGKLRGAKATVIAGAGHMLTIEKPAETLAALRAGLEPRPGGSAGR